MIKIYIYSQIELNFRVENQYNYIGHDENRTANQFFFWTVTELKFQK